MNRITDLHNFSMQSLHQYKLTNQMQNIYNEKLSKSRFIKMQLDNPTEKSKHVIEKCITIALPLFTERVICILH